MISSIFNTLYAALYGNLYLAVLAAFLWGLASILLSPCHLSGIALLIAMLTGKRVLKSKQAFLLSTIFALGVLASLALIGLITALLGRMIGDLGSHANLVFGIAMCIGGILLLDVIPFGAVSLISRMKIDGTKSLTIFVVGFLFGMALGPCAFAFMAPVLTLVFSVAETKMLMAVVIMLAYGIGHTSVIVAGGSSMGYFQKILNWNEDSKGLLIVKRICAVLVLAAGVYLIFK
jgi:cytochrome c-type biogenesis protein